MPWWAQQKLRALHRQALPSPLTHVPMAWALLDSLLVQALPFA